MPFTPTTYRVFIASPGGLRKERESFRKEIQQFNDARPDDVEVRFEAVGWELATGGAGRPQEQINEMVRRCDYFVLLLHNWWGSRPSTPGSPDDRGYTSGTQEEYEIARECLEDTERPMRDMLLCFKPVDPAQLADPGDQLKKVLAFKRDVEHARQFLYKEFEDEHDFRDKLRAKLVEWLSRHEDPDASSTTPPASDTGSAPPSVSDDLDVEALIAEAEHLADDGETVEAEVRFARAVSRGDSFDAFNAYGRFLFRLGRLDQARVLLDRALEIAVEQESEAGEATTYGKLGLILRTRGDLDGAEAMHRRALEINERLGRQEGMASDYGNLGVILQTRGDLDGAEAMLRRALEINERLGRQEGMANQYGNLGLILQTRGDLDGAEAMHRRSLEIEERLGRQEGMADAYGNLGLILQTRGDLDGAEAMLRRSLEINERLGRQEGMASDYGNLGLILQTRGDLDGAEAMHRRSLEIEERLGRQEGMASDYGNLGGILRTRGDLEGAEAMHRRSLEINERLGRQEGMASQYGNLGLILQTRGDLDGARELWTQSRDLFASIGMPHRVELVDSWLSGLDGPPDDEPPDDGASSPPS